MLRLVVDNGPIETTKGLTVLNCSYSEASYFDGYAFAHIAAWLEEQRMNRIFKRSCDELNRHRR